MAEQDSCPVCGALPCDWVNNPHESKRPAPGKIIAALCHLTDNPNTPYFFGKDLAEWRHRGRLWLLEEGNT